MPFAGIRVRPSQGSRSLAGSLLLRSFSRLQLSYRAIYPLALGPSTPLLAFCGLTRTSKLLLPLLLRPTPHSTTSMRLSVDSLDEQEQDLSKPLLHDEVSTFPPSSRRWHTASNSGTFRRRASILAGGLGLLLMGAALDRAVISLHPAPLPLPPPPMPRHPSRNESRAALLSPKALPDAVANNRALSQVSSV